jgi:hypothetical protein
MSWGASWSMPAQLPRREKLLALALINQPSCDEPIIPA